MSVLKPVTYDAPELLGELLLFEINPDYCRETVTVSAPATDIFMGSLLVKNADGSFTPWESADTDVAGIALRDTPASSEDVLVPVLRRGALVSAAKLKWPESVTDEQKATAKSALAAFGIIVR